MKDFKFSSPPVKEPGQSNLIIPLLTAIVLLRGVAYDKSLTWCLHNIEANFPQARSNGINATEFGKFLRAAALATMDTND